MRKTVTRDVERRLAVNTSDLQSMLGCGIDTATKIGTEARAKIQIGRRVIWNVEKIQAYLDKLSEGDVE